MKCDLATVRIHFFLIITLLWFFLTISCYVTNVIYAADMSYLYVLYFNNCEMLILLIDTFVIILMTSSHF